MEPCGGAGVALRGWSVVIAALLGVAGKLWLACARSLVGLVRDVRDATEVERLLSHAAAPRGLVDPQGRHLCVAGAHSRARARVRVRVCMCGYVCMCACVCGCCGCRLRSCPRPRLPRRRVTVHCVAEHKSGARQQHGKGQHSHVESIQMMCSPGTSGCPSARCRGADAGIGRVGDAIFFVPKEGRSRRSIFLL